MQRGVELSSRCLRASGDRVSHTLLTCLRTYFNCVIYIFVSAETKETIEICVIIAIPLIKFASGFTVRMDVHVQEKLFLKFPFCDGILLVLDICIFSFFYHSAKNETYEIIVA